MAKNGKVVKAKKIPVAKSGTGNPGSYPFGPGKVQGNATNPAVTKKEPKINKAKGK